MKCDKCRKPIENKKGIYIIGYGLLLHPECVKKVIVRIVVGDIPIEGDGS